MAKRSNNGPMENKEETKTQWFKALLKAKEKGEKVTETHLIVLFFRVVKWPTTASSYRAHKPNTITQPN